ncbi:MAG: PrsW family glutamic-type intramembrane protease [Patescibacteria group bacterium]
MIDPKTLLFAILGGAVPAIFWLWFWLRQEDSEQTVPRGIIALAFLLGAIIVVVAIWLEKISLSYVSNSTMQVITWATIEELLKFLVISFILFRSDIIRKPIDYPMYFIAGALGFAALENVLYLMHPLSTGGTVVGLLTGNLRFLGSTLLHAIASSMIGSALGLSFFVKEHRTMYLLCGISCAILLHSIFNFFIMRGSGENFLSVFGFLWVVVIINILIFEKLKRMGKYISL